MPAAGIRCCCLMCHPHRARGDMRAHTNSSVMQFDLLFRWMLVCSLAAGVLACSRPAHQTAESDGAAPSGPDWFQDVSDAWGFNFVHDPGETGTYFTPQSMGSGAAVFDFDGDG